jgi:serine/threonine protein phosphatase 1
VLGGLLNRRRAVPRPDGVLYAVGDIHGRDDLLDRLMRRILAEAAGAPVPPALVFLGDYVDRGPRARETVEVLMGLAGRAEVAPVFLMGNHERMLLDYLADPDTGTRWFRVGGIETLESYGLRVPGGAEHDPVALADLSEAFAEAVAPHRAFLEGLAPSHLSGEVLCVHAAADPARPPAAQEEGALLWGHRDFARRPRRDGLWVVHGHVVVPHPRVEGRRISVDTGAWFTDTLTAVRLDGDGIAFVTSD